MVLISPENLERMQRTQHQQDPRTSSIAALTDTNSVKSNAAITNTENVNNTVQTPGTPLSRLDAEMWRILNLATPNDENERWKLYKEVLQRYLYFVRKTKKRLRDESSRNEDVDENDNEQYENTSLNDDEDDLTETRTLISGNSGESGSSSFGKKRVQTAEMIKEILAGVPKSYHGKARALLKYLCDIPSSKISWNRRGLVSIDGVVVTGSNISDLINDAIRERKTVKATGRIQFAQLLHDINTPPNLIGNRDLLRTIIQSRHFKDALPRGSSTPKTPLRTRSYRRKLETEETEGDTTFVSAYEDSGDNDDEGNKTLASNTGSSTNEKRRRRELLNWNKL